MKFERIPWHLIAGLILGLGLGLAISWGIAPAAYTDTPPSILRSDFKDSYRTLIASAFATTGDLEQAEKRLTSLADEDPIQSLTVQAQRELADGNLESSEILANLAAALQAGDLSIVAETPTPAAISTSSNATPTVTLIIAGADPTDIPQQTPDIPVSTPTEIPLNTRTPAPPPTSIPTISAPFVLMTQDEICTETLSEGLLMVIVNDAAQRPLAGVEIIVEWSGNEEHFFTGLKPELGKGYADFTMQPNQSYALRIATGSTAVGNLSAPPCQDDDGNHYWGSLRLSYQQP